MLNQLLETKRATNRKPGVSVVSIAVHLVVIGVVATLTQRAVEAAPKPVETIVHMPQKPAPVPEKRIVPATAIHTSASRSQGPLTLQAPTDIPIDIPVVDLSRAPITEATFATNGALGDPSAHPDAGAQLSGDQPWSDRTVDKAAVAMPGTAAPTYPEMLKSAGVEGEALVQFVVDTLGRAEPGSFRVLRETHAAFGESVRAALPRMRFLPAEAGGRKVRMLVQQPFAFALNK
jgi:periplasmic protein TonB